MEKWNNIEQVTDNGELMWKWLFSVAVEDVLVTSVCYYILLNRWASGLKKKFDQPPGSSIAIDEIGGADNTN